MRKLTAFNFISLDGYYKDVNNSMNWHKHGEDEEGFSAESLKAENVLLFGRVTYEMMAGFWPTQMALDTMPTVAEGMNRSQKIVFSRTMKKADWNNTTIMSENIVEEIKKLKQTPGNDMTILGSGTIISQFAEAGLIDGYEIMIDPVALGNGTSIFKNMNTQLDLKLTASRSFKTGVMLLSYEPA